MKDPIIDGSQDPSSSGQKDSWRTDVEEALVELVRHKRRSKVLSFIVTSFRAVVMLVVGVYVGYTASQKSTDDRVLRLVTTHANNCVQNIREISDQAHAVARDRDAILASVRQQKPLPEAPAAVPVPAPESTKEQDAQKTLDTEELKKLLDKAQEAPPAEEAPQPLEKEAE